ncbi:MATE family efflux transporter [Caproicibacter fermentans]|uniref:Probable multidrug resistance protein NorM n=1 Tax=Caproicibacter fermentans TaxID=2576756 RepID=A0A7G8T768_9FIRM|nr:MATE family efflux transporter [Caproicibacter fermentans]QNK39459.1 MATE family efflux transporter [Caproicibacter fermentans]
MKSRINFAEEKTTSGLMKMALPLLMALVLNMAYNLVDSLWIGNLLGESAMAALTSSTPIILILTALGMGASNGLSIPLSQAIGAKDEKRVTALISTSFMGFLVMSVLLTGLCEGFADGILRAMNTPASVFPLAKSYLALYLLALPADYFYLYFTAVLRSYGNTTLQAVSILFCTILNACLDPLFIHLWGFAGAAAATLLSQTLSMVILLLYIAGKKLFHFQLSAVDWNEGKQILFKALPSAVQQSIPALSTGVLTAIVGGFGVTAIAAYGVTGKLEVILFYPAMALNMALTTITGQCFGAGRADRAADYTKKSLLFGCVLLVLLTVPVVGFAGSLSGLFLNSADVAKIVAWYFGVIGVGYVLNTVTNCILGTMNGLGKPGMGMALMIFYYIVIRMPLAFVLSRGSLGLGGVWWAVLVSHAVAAVSAAALFRFLYIRNERMQEAARN